MRGRSAATWVVFLCLPLALSGCGQDSPPDVSQKTGETVEPTNGIYYIEVSGTPKEMGKRHGSLLKKVVEAQVRDYRKQVAAHFGPKNAERILEHVIEGSHFLRDIQKHLPHVYQEMEGIAEGASVSVNDILLLNMYEEVYEGAPADLNIKPLPQEGGGKCTTLSCFGRKGMPNLNAQNLDYTPNLNGAQLMIHFTYPSGLKILLYTFVGQVGGIGVNNKGLSMVCNTLPEGSKRAKTDGLGGTYTTRGLLEQESVATAIDWLKKMPQFGAYHYALVDHTRATLVEFSPKGLVELPATGSFLAHTNHMLELADRNEILPEFPGGRPVGDAAGKTLARLEKAKTMLAEKAEQTGVEDLKKILTTSPVNNDGKVWSTLQSIIVVHGQDLRVYASARNNPKRTWNDYRFK